MAKDADPCLWTTHHTKGNKMDCFEYFKKLVSLPSPSKDEGLVSAFLKEEMTSFGYSYNEDEVGNLLFYKNPGTEKTLFCAHMDTVQPALNAHLVETEDRFETDKETALGADDKAALAVMLEVARDADDNFALLAICAEEIGLYGSSKLNRKFFSPITIEYAYVFDAQKSVGTIISSAIGKSRLTLSFKGKSAHAGFAPENGVNAIMMASTFCSSLTIGRIDKNTTSNIGSFIAEGSTNVVPELATVQLEVRSDSNQKRYAMIDEMLKKANEVAKDFKGTVESVNEDLYQPYSIDKESELFKKAESAISKAGLDVNVESTTGGSDANNLNKLGIPTLLFTSGYYNGHAKSEYIEKKEFVAMRDIMRNLLEK